MFKFESNTQRPNGINYTTYDNGRITKATLNGVQDNFYNAFSRCMCNSKYFTIRPGYYQGQALFMDNIYTSKAKLNPLDNDDPELAKNICHKRVMKKYHKAFDSRMRLVIEDLHRITANLYRYCEKKGIDISNVKSVDTYLDEIRQI